MTRAEHIKWCKERAIAEMDFYDKPEQGIISMMSDLRKHPETNNDTMQTMCAMMLVAGKIKSRQQAIDFINGFN